MTDQYAVVDTSCAISYYLGRKSVDRAALDHLRKSHGLLVSEETHSEFRQVILRPKFDRIPIDIRLGFLDNYSKLVELFDPHKIVRACIDPKDDKFLSLAVSAKASLILTNDDHLLRLNPFQGISILTPQQYLDAHAIDPNPR
jgi:putative PIN family toxin of toxin-antitoxin system